MAVGPEQRLSPEERANLAAYIDGELTENEARVISTKLSFSPTARREVESLKKTWELLEYLPRPKASEDFPERTLTSLRSLDARAAVLGTGDLRLAGSGGQAGVCLAVAAASLAAGLRADALGLARSRGPDGQGALPGRASRGIPGGGLLRVPGGAGEVQGVRWSLLIEAAVPCRSHRRLLLGRVPAIAVHRRC